jgi:LmbE family N-acetylglucosaminyl deacetylase
MATVLALMAHPDDIEILCAGTLAHLARAGWKVHLASMTAGDLGSMTQSRAGISKVRKAEAARSAALLGASYSCVGLEDLCIAYGAAAKRRVSALLRRVKPDLLVTHARLDYMADHEETGRIAREAAFCSTIPNWKDGEEPCEALPAILHADPIENSDADGRRVPARLLVDITATMATKEKMLACHASQRDWLRAQHGEDEYINSMKRWSADRARDFRRKSVRYAEGFTPHWGHAFPKRDVLREALGRTLVKRLS